MGIYKVPVLFEMTLHHTKVEMAALVTVVGFLFLNKFGKEDWSTGPHSIGP